MGDSPLQNLLQDPTGLDRLRVMQEMAQREATMRLEQQMRFIHFPEMEKMANSLERIEEHLERIALGSRDLRDLCLRIAGILEALPIEKQISDLLSSASSLASASTSSNNATGDRILDAIRTFIDRGGDPLDPRVSALLKKYRDLGVVNVEPIGLEDWTLHEQLGTPVINGASLSAPPVHNNVPCELEPFPIAEALRKPERPEPCTGSPT